MCGINGLTGSSEESVRSMNEQIRHRGPDSSGVFVDTHVSLGHVLLSIRGDSISHSVQPFISADRQWVLLFNGEIYNTQEVCQRHGLPFLDLDTEIIMTLIEKKGWDFVEDLQGMFTIALYSVAEKKLKLYRDRTGQKCLYYFVKDDSLWFSSELKVLVPFLKRKDISLEGLEMALTIGYIPAPYTLFQDIKKLNPGECIEWDFSRKKILSTKFKSAIGNTQDDPYEYLSKNIQLHSLSKQKVGVNLSGGLDSSIVLYELVRNGVLCDTYTTRFETKDPRIYNEEFEIAKKMSQDFGVKHHEVYITKKKYLSNFIEAFEVVEEPNHNIGLPHYLALAKEQGKSGDGIRVLLAGDGGDEVFAGYDYYFQNAAIIENTNLFEKIIKNPILKMRSQTSLNFYDPTDRWLWVKSFRNKFNHVNFDRSYSNLKKSFEFSAGFYPEKESSIHKLMLMDRMLWLSGENFVRTDKIFMSQSIEIRSPFAYYPIRCYFDKVLKDNDYTDGILNKRFLRQLYKEKLPNYVVERERKWGWKPPWNEWFDLETKSFLADLFGGLKDSEMIRWQDLRKSMLEAQSWPGREFWSYVSLAVLIKKYGVQL